MWRHWFWSVAGVTRSLSNDLSQSSSWSSSVPVMLFQTNSAALLPGFTDRQPELHTILEQPVLLLKIGFILLPPFEVWFHFLFSDALLCQAFSPRSTIMQHVEIPSESLHNLVTYIYHRGIRGCQYLSSNYLRLGIPSSVQLHLLPYSVLCIACGFHMAEDSPVPNHGFFCFQRIVENEQSDMALLKSR